MGKLMALAILNIAVFFSAIVFAGVRANVTGSAPVGLYVKAGQAYVPGDLVEACLPAAAARLAVERGYLSQWGVCDNHTPVLKRVLALEGDQIDVDHYVVLNGEVVSSAPVLSTDTSGRPLEAASGGEMGPDDVWLISDHIPNSYDSRYFGPVARRYVRSRMKPLWTL